MINPQFSTTLTGTCIYPDGKEHPFLLPGFKIESDFTIMTQGADSLGNFVYAGKVDKEGKLTMVRHYPNNPSVPPAFFSGELDFDCSIQGTMTGGGSLSSLPASRFSLAPKTFRHWGGELTAAGGQRATTSLCFGFEGNQIYGFGKNGDGVYILKGSFDPASKLVSMHEYSSSSHASFHRWFQGQGQEVAGKKALVGTWTTPEMATGSFTFFLSEEMPHLVPPMTTIDMRPENPSLQASTARLAKENAKPGVADSKTRHGQFTVIPPAGPQNDFYAPTQTYSAPQPAYNVQRNVAVFANGGGEPFVDRAWIANASSPMDVQQVGQAVMSGKKVEVDCLISFYKIVSDPNLRMAMTATVANHLVGVNQQTFYECVKLNPHSNVQMCIVQTFSQYLRGQITPYFTASILDVITMERDKRVAAAILNTI